MDAELKQKLINTEHRYRSHWVLGHIQALAELSENDHETIKNILDAIKTYDNVVSEERNKDDYTNETE